MVEISNEFKAITICGKAPEERGAETKFWEADRTKEWWRGQGRGSTIAADPGGKTLNETGNRKGEKKNLNYNYQV